MKVAFQETPSGKAMDFSHFYDQFLQNKSRIFSEKRFFHKTKDATMFGRAFSQLNKAVGNLFCKNILLFNNL